MIPPNSQQVEMFMLLFMLKQRLLIFVLFLLNYELSPSNYFVVFSDYDTLTVVPGK